MAGLDRFINEISAGKNIMLDTNAVIYYLDGTLPFMGLMSALFPLVEEGRLSLNISVITEAELLVKPYREKRKTAIEAINFFLDEFPNLKIVPVTREISRQAAKIRAETDMRLPDAIILATAIDSQCDLMVGNDTVLMRKARLYLPTIILQEYI